MQERANAALQRRLRLDEMAVYLKRGICAAGVALRDHEVSYGVDQKSKLLLYRISIVVPRAERYSKRIHGKSKAEHWYRETE